MTEYVSRGMSVRTQTHSLRAGTRTSSFRRQLRVLRYTPVPLCPACDRKGTYVDSLNRGVYRFGPFDIPYPADGSIPIHSCGSCGLLFKSIVPDCTDLRRLYEDTASRVWPSHRYDYRYERDYVLRFAGNRSSIDILNIGSAKGDLLAAFKGIPGRRSALDLVRNASCARHVSGEYLEQYLEDTLEWSGQPYDVVLAFDVLERLYHGQMALSNLASLIRPGGLLIVQTADAAYLKATSRLRDWWYLNRLEHHMAWTPESLSRAAKRSEFRLEHSEIGRHKDTRYMPAWKRAGVCAFRALSHVPGAGSVAVALTSRDPKLVGQPGSDDHFTAVLRRGEELSDNARRKKQTHVV
jgi:2-polyprenyl-3-methyl-5-hydroxy-6-metoxy-1,4-benzoquinol methylase